MTKEWTRDLFGSHVVVGDYVVNFAGGDKDRIDVLKVIGITAAGRVQGTVAASTRTNSLPGHLRRRGYLVSQRFVLYRPTPRGITPSLGPWGDV